jgi:carboxylesterase
MKRNKHINSFVDLSYVDYNELLILDTKRAYQEEIITEDTLPFLRKGNIDESIMLIHDLGGSPDELRIMAEYIGKLGYSTYNCRLPGHGSKINYFTKFSFIDWYESLKYGYFSLKYISKKIIIIGKGIGAYLGILISMFNKVDRLILLLPQPNKTEAKRNNLQNKFLYRLKGIYPNYNHTEENQHYTYRYFTKKTINEGNKLINFLIKNIHLYNRSIPITIHPYKSKNIYYFSRSQFLINELLNANIKVDIFNMDFLNKFRVVKDA